MGRVCQLCFHPVLSTLRSAGGGLASVYMSWSAAEYLYMLLLMNQTLLPPEALFIIRYQKVGSCPPWRSAHQPQHCLNRCLAFACMPKELLFLNSFARASVHGQGAACLIQKCPRATVAKEC